MNPGGGNAPGVHCTPITCSRSRVWIPHPIGRQSSLDRNTDASNFLLHAQDDVRQMTRRKREEFTCAGIPCPARWVLIGRIFGARKRHCPPPIGVYSAGASPSIVGCRLDPCPRSAPYLLWGIADAIPSCTIEHRSAHWDALPKHLPPDRCALNPGVHFLSANREVAS
jgi:hypothetical protein